MARRRNTVEQNIGRLRVTETQLAPRATTAEVYRALGVTGLSRLVVIGNWFIPFDV